MYGLIIGIEPVDQIIRGEKTWEMRGRATKLRGRIALIKKGTKSIVGFADIVDVHGPLSLAEQRKSKHLHLPTPEEYRDGLPYETAYAWELKNIVRLKRPIPYKHPSGAVIWVANIETLTDTNIS
jgi:hypothetical protein